MFLFTLTLFTLFPKRYEFGLVWFVLVSLPGLFLNTVREFPKFVRHLVRVLKVVLFKVFLDFRFNYEWEGGLSVRWREKKIVK